MNNLKAKLNAKLKKQGGFTLIEMLIVVAIIAILIAIAIPMVNSALESAREATDSANERSALGLAMVQVMTKNELAGQTIGTTEVSAYYKIDGSEGSLVASTGTKPDAYGKGTAAGENPTPHVGQVIKVTFDPTETDEDQQFEVTWE